MYPRKITNNLWILGHDDFHIYLIQGNSACALVEAGISATSDLVLEQLALLKVKPDFFIVTHPHSDHVTGLGSLRKSFPDATILAGQGAEAFLHHPKSTEILLREDLFMAKAMAPRGLFSTKTWTADLPLLSGCKVVRTDDELALGGITCRFLEVKGHSPGQIVAYVPEIKALLVSDSLGNLYPGKGFFPTFFTGYSDYLATIDKLAGMDPMILGLGHHGLFCNHLDIENLFGLARQAALDVKNYVLNDNRDANAIAQDLFHFYYCDELAVYSKENIMNCCRLLVRRVREIPGSPV
ncbi:MAG: MBL fold metallo-hydrolase [Syntrophaceae bacterium]|nr:MBL fold metallo-hydrolase [Syntrophaceae bacterium]